MRYLLFNSGSLVLLVLHAAPLGLRAQTVPDSRCKHASENPSSKVRDLRYLRRLSYHLERLVETNVFTTELPWCNIRCSTMRHPSWLK